MNALQIILLPFTYFYRGVKTILLSPLYLFKLIGKKSTIKQNTSSKEKTVIAEAKKNDEKIVVKEKRSIVEGAPDEVKPEKKPVANPYTNDKRKQELYNKYMKKAREEELKRVHEIEVLKAKNAEKEKARIEKELANSKEEEQEYIEANKKAEEAKKAGKVPFSVKFNEIFNKPVQPVINPIELEARKQVLSEGFKEQVKKDENLRPMLFTYIARNSKGEIEKSQIEALTRMDVQSFLLTEGYEIYDIFPAKKGIEITPTSSKIKISQLVFYLSQLSAYLKSGIALADGVKILYEQAKVRKEKAIWKSVYYDLSMGDVLSVAMDKRGDAFPKLLINMIKTAEMTGDLADTIDDMVDYYTQMDQTRKQMKSAMTYPKIILGFSLLVIIFIFVFVIPEFNDIFAELGTKPPWYTRLISDISEFLNPFGETPSYGGVFILGGIMVLALIFMSMYRNVRSFRKVMQEIAMHIPVFGKIIIYNEVAIFTKTFANLINHNVFITDSIGILSKITENEIYKKLIFETSQNLSKGEAISKAFKNHWAFPNIAYQMLTTGEKTGRLGPMMEKVAEYYEEQHRNIINQLKTLIEPALIIFLAVVVGFILMAVLVPMFSVYESIQS